MKTLHILHFALLVLLAILSSNARAQFDNMESDCIKIDPKGSMTLPKAPIAGSSEGTFVMTNISSNPIIVQQPIFEFGNAYFNIVSHTFPVEVAGNGSVTFTVRFTPTSSYHARNDLGALGKFEFPFGGTGIDTNICHYIIFFVSGDTLETQSGVASEVNETVFNVYPNPATEKVDVSVTRGLMHQVEVFDALGAAVAGSKNVQRWTWDLRTTSGSNAPSGVYFIRVVTSDAGGDHVMTKKVIVK